MNFRKISIVLGVLILVGGIVASRFMGSSEKQETQALVKQARLVQHLRVKTQTILAPIQVTGKLAAPNKVEIFAEVKGVLSRASARFKAGNQFGQGAILLQINAEQDYFALLSQKSSLFNALTRMMPDMKLDYPQAYPKWQAYLDSFQVEKPLSPLPATESNQEKYYVVAQNIYSQYYTIKSQEARLQKYNIYAPFTGVVTESLINPGTLVRDGQKLGEFINPYNFELEADMSVKDLDFLGVGDQVELYSEDISGTWPGVVKRVNRRLDPATQTVKAYIATSGKKLREGMFLTGNIRAEEIKEAIKIPRNLVFDQNKIYVIEKGKLKIQTVEVIRYLGNDAVVKGLKNKTVLLNESSKEFYEGLEVRTQS